MRKNNTAIIFGSLFFSCSVMAANGTLAPTVVPMVNGGQASIAISNTSPNLFTVPGDRITGGRTPSTGSWRRSLMASGIPMV